MRISAIFWFQQAFLLIGADIFIIKGILINEINDKRECKMTRVKRTHFADLLIRGCKFNGLIIALEPIQFTPQVTNLGNINGDLKFRYKV